MLGWVRVSWSVPQRPRSYAALRLPCRVGTPSVFPRPCLTRWASVASAPGGVCRHVAGRRSLATDGASERVTGSPSPGSANWTVRGLPGYRAVLFARAACQPPRRVSPRLASYRLRECCFQGWETSEHPGLSSFGADTRGPRIRLTTHQPPPHGDGCKPGYRPAGYALAGWGSHPQDDSSEFLVYILTSSLTGRAWSLLPSSHGQLFGKRGW